MIVWDDEMREHIIDKILMVILRDAIARGGYISVNRLNADLFRQYMHDEPSFRVVEVVGEETIYQADIEALELKLSLLKL